MFAQYSTSEKVKNFFEGSEFLYIIYSEYGCKIGISNSPLKRLDQIKQGFPSQNALLIGLYSGENNAKFEQALHQKYKERKIAGEWFILNQENLDEIDSYLLTNKFVRILKVSILWANYLFPSIYLSGNIRVIEVEKDYNKIVRSNHDYSLLDDVLVVPSSEEVNQKKCEWLLTKEICLRVENIYPDINPNQLGKYLLNRGFKKYPRWINKAGVRTVRRGYYIIIKDIPIISYQTNSN